MQLTDRDSGKVLWQAENIRVVEDSSSVPQVAVTTSPDFLQGTLDPQDLSGFTDIQFSETQRRISMERLVREAAQEAYFRLGENF
jgi:PBP1b-binding outer membrane lipoprotein LpoB